MDIPLALSLLILLLMLAACMCIGSSYRQDMKRRQEWDD
jgi:hypothetical protein